MSSHLPVRSFATLLLAALSIALPGAPAFAVGAVAAPSPSWSALREPGVGGAVTALSVSPTDASRVLVGGDMLGIGVSEDGGRSWQPTYGLGSYEVASFTWDPANSSRVWAATMSGPYLSVDGGHTWAARRAGLPSVQDWAYSAPVQQVLFDPADGRHLLAFSGSLRGWGAANGSPWGTVWESRDSGASWSTLSRLPGAAPVQSVVYTSGTALLAAGRKAGLFRSLDGGRTWTGVAGSTAWDVHELVADAAHRQNVWLSTGSEPTTDPAPVGGVLRSVDAGKTWTRAVDGLSQANNADRNLRSRYSGLYRSRDGRLFVSDNAWSVAAVYSSVDDGHTWHKLLDNASRPVSPFASGMGMTAVTTSSDGRTVFAGNQELIVASTDGGTSWHDSATDQVAPGLYRGRGYSGLVATGVHFNPFREGDLSLTAMDGGNVVQSMDGGTSWRRSMCAWDCWGGAYDAAYAPGGTMYALLGQAGMFNGIARSVDDGKTWIVAVGAKAGLPERASWDGGNPGGVWAVDTTTVVATAGGKAFRSTDGGASWSRVVAGGAGHLTGAPSDRRRLWLSTASGLQTSTDGGATFIAAPAAPTVDADAQVTVSPTDPGVVFVPQWRYGGLWRYDGTSSTLVLQDSTVLTVAVEPQDPQVLLAVSNDHPFHDIVRGGVHLSRDGGRTWSELTAGLPVLRASAVAFDPFHTGRVVIGTYGRGFFSTSISVPTADPALPAVPAGVPDAGSNPSAPGHSAPVPSASPTSTAVVPPTTVGKSAPTAVAEATRVAQTRAAARASASSAARATAARATAARAAAARATAARAAAARATAARATAAAARAKAAHARRAGAAKAAAGLVARTS